MRVHQIIEAKVDLTPLSNVWKSGVVDAVVHQLRDIKTHPAQLLANVVEKSAQSKADSDPIGLLSLLKALISFFNSQEKHDIKFRLKAVYTDLFSDLISVILKMPNPPLKELGKMVDIPTLPTFLGVKLGADLQLAHKKATRTAKEKKIDKENELFAFVGRPAFVERPEGSGNYKKTLEIERLIKIDPHSIEDHQVVAQLKMRARVQGQDSEVYSILLPKGAYKQGDGVPDWLVDVIDEHKRKITN